MKEGGREREGMCEGGREGQGRETGWEGKRERERMGVVGEERALKKGRQRSLHC